MVNKIYYFRLQHELPTGLSLWTLKKMSKNCHPGFYSCCAMMCVNITHGPKPKLYFNYDFIDCFGQFIENSSNKKCSTSALSLSPTLKSLDGARWGELGPKRGP